MLKKTSEQEKIIDKLLKKMHHSITKTDSLNLFHFSPEDNRKRFHSCAIWSEPDSDGLCELKWTFAPWKRDKYGSSSIFLEAHCTIKIGGKYKADSHHLTFNLGDNAQNRCTSIFYKKTQPDPVIEYSEKNPASGLFRWVTKDVPENYPRMIDEICKRLVDWAEEKSEWNDKFDK